MNPAKNRFTLIELLVVIAIIAILASMLLPALRNAREKGYEAQCISTLKQHGITVTLYADDNDETLPGAVQGTPIAGVATSEWEYLFSHNFPGGLCMLDYYGIDPDTSMENGYLAGHNANYCAGRVGSLVQKEARIQKFCCPAFIRRWRGNDITFYQPSGTQYKENPSRRGYIHSLATNSVVGGPYRGAPGWRKLSTIGSRTDMTGTGNYQDYWSQRTQPSRLVIICDYNFPTNVSDVAPYCMGNGHMFGYGYLTLDGAARIAPQQNIQPLTGWDNAPGWILVSP